MFSSFRETVTLAPMLPNSHALTLCSTLNVAAHLSCPAAMLTVSSCSDSDTVSSWFCDLTHDSCCWRFLDLDVYYVRCAARTVCSCRFRLAPSSHLTRCSCLVWTRVDRNWSSARCCRWVWTACCGIAVSYQHCRSSTWELETL